MGSGREVLWFHHRIKDGALALYLKRGVHVCIFENKMPGKCKNGVI